MGVTDIIYDYWLCILQMSRNLHSSGGAGGNEDLPLPPPPTPAELMAMLVEGQRALADALRNMANRDGRNVRQGPELN
jgi:hypothetical protein